jgi:hypothetical protein
MSTIEDLLGLLDQLPEEKLAKIKQGLDSLPDRKIWVPNPGAQTEFFNCQADELFCGGEAGPGKTDVIVGLSLTEHWRSLVLRRTNKEATKLVERYVEILGSRKGWNGQDNVWHLPDGRLIDIGGCQHEDDKQKRKGTPHDFIGFDEISDFTETQYRFIIGWNRSTRPGQRSRVVAAGNPPTTPEGLWVIEYWGPWLHPNHPNPAKDGELRWFTTIAGKDTEVDGPGPHLVDGRMERARSRTFIRGHLDENPNLARTNYSSVLAALPAELRDAYKLGKFDAALRDHPKQLIPTAWIMAAQQRWKDSGGKPPAGVPMVAVGLDVAMGGADQTVLAPRHDGWFAPLVAVPGSETPMGSDVVALLIKHRRDGAAIIIDAGGGYAGATMQVLKDNKIKPDPIVFNGAAGSTVRTNDRIFGFVNKRAEAHWRFREALDPGQAGGSPIELPDDPALRAELAAVHFEIGTRGIQIEDKDEIKKRIGRSPDKADAVVLSWSEGQKALRRGLIGPNARDENDRQSFAKVRPGPLTRKNRYGQSEDDSGTPPWRR